MVKIYYGQCILLGFENYSETLKIYLKQHRQYEQEQLSLKPPRKKNTEKEN